jgi:hypothetical protein
MDDDTYYCQPFIWKTTFDRVYKVDESTSPSHSVTSIHSFGGLHIQNGKSGKLIGTHRLISVIL